MSDNIYQTPQSAVVDEDSLTNVDLASRWARLGAAFIDGLLMMIIILPVAFVFGIFEALASGGQMGLTTTVAMGFLGIAAFFILNGYLLSSNGQTIGKKLLGIKIVDLEGRKPPFGRLIGMRYVPVWLVVYIPIIGNFASFIDNLFIFRGDKRCIHDLIAGTQVINA